jgi:phosphatidylethanolamine/phosphatidyl-N-methylethanolamine N-methyltransferase
LRQPFHATDRMGRGKAKPTLEERFADEARFIKAWFDNPLTTGAVYPSGKVLSRTMARAVDAAVPGPVIELGPGTGPVTEALIRRGITQDRLILVEFDPDFCRLLSRRYPLATVVQGDAYALSRSLGSVLQDRAAAIVSSLPLLTKPERQRLALVEEAFDLMHEDGVFVQFTYGLGSPVPRVDDRFVPTGFAAQVSPPVWLNFPPARVWTYRGRHQAATQPAVEPRPDLIDKLKIGTEKLGDEWREARERLRRQFLLRAEKAKAEFRARTEKVRTSLGGDDLRLPETRRGLRDAQRRTSDKRNPHR